MKLAHAPEPWAVQELTDDDWPAAIVSTQYWSEDDGEPEQGSAVIAQFISRELAEEFLRRYNALAGLNPEAVPELLAIIDIALSCWGFMVEDLRVSQDERAAAERMRVRARAAIAKATS